MTRGIRERAAELLKGAYDLHTHSAPSLIPREVDDIQLLWEANDCGMAGVLIKSHFEPTQSRATLLNLCSGATAQAYGAVVLNQTVGGLNPYAVENAARTGAKVIWLPTMDALHAMSFGPTSFDKFERPGLTVFDEKGNLSKETLMILEVARAFDLPVATGHLGPKEIRSVCKAAKRMGIQMVLTHPDWLRTVMSRDTQVELARDGVIIEKASQNVETGCLTIERLAKDIRDIGAQNMILVTDRGQQNCVRPAQSLRGIVEGLLDCGIGDEELSHMLRKTPRRLLRLD